LKKQVLNHTKATQMFEFLWHVFFFILALIWGLTMPASVGASAQYSSVYFSIYNLTADSVLNRTDTALFRILYP